VRTLNVLLALSVFAPRALSAQTAQHSHDGQPHPVWTGISALAQQQIRTAEQAVMRFSTTDSASVAGFQPVFGWIPTMGTHWVSKSWNVSDRSFDFAHPSELLFSPIDGRETLVGAAYGYIAADTDAARPVIFDGNPSWHDHPNLAPPGQTLVMLHVWFVASPDGPFAGHNPNLPFWAVGLVPPPVARLHDASALARFRKTSLALSVVADTSGLFPALDKRPAVHEIVSAQREQIRALIPVLDRAQKAGDWEQWNRTADEAVLHWEAVRQAYLDTTRNPQVHERVQRLMDEMATGAHDMSTAHH
jgi:hypothetical protein